MGVLARRTHWSRFFFFFCLSILNQHFQHCSSHIRRISKLSQWREVQEILASYRCCCSAAPNFMFALLSETSTDTFSFGVMLHHPWFAEERTGPHTLQRETAWLITWIRLDDSRSWERAPSIHQCGDEPKKSHLSSVSSRCQEKSVETSEQSNSAFQKLKIRYKKRIYGLLIFIENPETQ